MELIRECLRYDPERGRVELEDEFNNTPSKKINMMSLTDMWTDMWTSLAIALVMCIIMHVSHVT